MAGRLTNHGDIGRTADAELGHGVGERGLGLGQAGLGLGDVGAGDLADIEPRLGLVELPVQNADIILGDA